MSTKKLAGLLTATAFAALIAAPAVHAQTMASPPPQMVAPQAVAPMPMQQPPAEVDYYSDAPKADPGDSNWSARQNVSDSQRYEALVHANPAFRAARIQKECGSITEPGLYQQCVASFNN